MPRSSTGQRHASRCSQQRSRVSVTGQALEGKVGRLWFLTPWMAVTASVSGTPCFLLTSCGCVTNAYMCVAACHGRVGLWLSRSLTDSRQASEIRGPEYPLAVLMLKRQCLGHLMRRTDSLQKTLMLGKIEGRRRDDRGWDGWMATPTRWTWVWASSGRWWWTGRPGVLWSMGSQRVKHNWVTELTWCWEGTPGLAFSASAVVSPLPVNNWDHLPILLRGVTFSHGAIFASFTCTDSDNILLLDESVPQGSPHDL